MPKGFILVACEGMDDSTIEWVGGLFGSVGDAALAAGHDLRTKHGVSEEIAGEFVGLIGKNHGTGESGKLSLITYNPASNRNYVILTADFTSNGMPIVPGLRIRENNMREGVVDAAQFMDGGMLVPGGQFFDHWYYVLRDGEDRAVERFDGGRMEALPPAWTHYQVFTTTGDPDVEDEHGEPHATLELALEYAEAEKLEMFLVYQARRIRSTQPGGPDRWMHAGSYRYCSS